MHRYILNVVLFILVSRNKTFAVSDDYYQFAGCELQTTPCNPGNDGSVKIIKDDKSAFKRCPKTSPVCMEKNIQVYLNDSRLYLYDGGALNILENSSIRITRNGICKVFGRGFVELRNATIIIDNGQLGLESRGEIYNKGSIYIGNDSLLHVISNSLVSISQELSGTAGGSLGIDKSSKASITDYSNVKLVGGSELRATTGYNKLELNSQSLIEMYNGDIFMSNGSELKVMALSALNVGYYLCSRNGNKTRFIFGVGAYLLIMHNSKIHLQSGRIELDDHARLWVEYSSSVYVNGFLRVMGPVHPNQSHAATVYVSNGKKVTVGKRYPGEDHCHTDSSLIIWKGESMLPQHLEVMRGAHCLMKPTDDYLGEVAHLELRADSETDKFKCFKSRNELMESVKKLSGQHIS